MQWDIYIGEKNCNKLTVKKSKKLLTYVFLRGKLTELSNSTTNCFKIEYNLRDS